MLGRSKKATVKEKIASAYALALQLAVAVLARGAPLQGWRPTRRC